MLNSLARGRVPNNVMVPFDERKITVDPANFVVNSSAVNDHHEPKAVIAYRSENRDLANK